MGEQLRSRAEFRSFFLGGFECSTHRSQGGRRLDLIDATCHDRFALKDYGRLRQLSILSARDGIRWHEIEKFPGSYDFSSAVGLIRAARDTGIQIIWDLCHYGWPDDIDIFKPAFIDRFARMVRAFMRVLANETDDVPYLVPVNEISFFSWASGEAGAFYPYAMDRGNELKRQLVRASIAAIEAIWEQSPAARIVHVDPIINVIFNPERPEERERAEAYHKSQYHALDMIRGDRAPELGGSPRYLDIIGVNYYPHNQWMYSGSPLDPGIMIERGHPQYRPFREMLLEFYRRYNRPLFISETGTEDEERVGWFRYVCREVRAAVRAGVPLEGICLYPIVNHPGWADDRHCHNGLWDYASQTGEREVYEPLAAELRRQRRHFERFFDASNTPLPDFAVNQDFEWGEPGPAC